MSDSPPKHSLQPPRKPSSVQPSNYGITTWVKELLNELIDSFTPPPSQDPGVSAEEVLPKVPLPPDNAHFKHAAGTRTEKQARQLYARLAYYGLDILQVCFRFETVYAVSYTVQFNTTKPFIPRPKL